MSATAVSAAKEPISPGTIYLLRHGAVQIPGKGRRYVGWQNLLLSALGKRQAHAWADYFSCVPLEEIYCSDLARCQDTARIIAGRCSLAPRALTDLREICLGQWEGRSFDSVRASDSDAFQRRGEHLSDHRPPGGESFVDLQGRAWPVFAKLASGAHRKILVVTHAGVIRVLLCRLLGMPLENLFRIELGYGGLCIITVGPQEFRVRAVNLSPPGIR